MSHTPHAPQLDDVRHELATANRILYAQGVLDAFGHVSVRHPDDPGRFLISRNRAPALVAPDDIQVLDLDGDPVDGAQVPLYLERFIHAAMYAADPEVMAVVHSHSPSVVPFTVSKQARLRPVCHMTGFLAGHVPVFEIREHAGEASDLLIRSAALGDALARTRGDAAVVLMRGHGLTVVGDGIRDAVLRAVYTEKGARVQMEAERMGACEFLSPGEMASCEESIASQTQRAWDFWCWQLEQQGLALKPRPA